VITEGATKTARTNLSVAWDHVLRRIPTNPLAAAVAVISPTPLVPFALGGSANRMELRESPIALGVGVAKGAPKGQIVPEENVIKEDHRAIRNVPEADVIRKVQLERLSVPGADVLRLA